MLSWIGGLWGRLRGLVRRMLAPGQRALPQSVPQYGITRREAREPSGASGTGGASGVASPAAPVSTSAELPTAATAATGGESPAAAMVAAAVEASSVVESTPSTDGIAAGARPPMSVRRYFGRMVSATPAGLAIDFTRWQAATVERYFMAITSPELIRRREAPTTGAEAVRLTTAFEGFEWD